MVALMLAISAHDPRSGVRRQLIYDEYAAKAVKQAAPFPPIPDSISTKGVPIHATFRYVVETSRSSIE
jgi:hypothetical protein